MLQSDVFSCVVSSLGGLFSIVWLISMLFAKVKTISSASSELGNVILCS